MSVRTVIDNVHDALEIGAGEKPKKPAYQRAVSLTVAALHIGVGDVSVVVHIHPFVSRLGDVRLG